MNLKKQDLNRAVQKNIIDEDQAEKLWNFLNQNSPEVTSAIESNKPAFSSSFSNLDVGTVVSYLGALIVLLSLGWLADLFRNQLGSYSLFWIGLVYGAIFLFAGLKLWNHSSYKVGGGLLVTLAVCMVPLMLYGLEKGAGWWPLYQPLNASEGSYAIYEKTVAPFRMSLAIATILAAATMLRFVRFPFLSVPLYVAVLFFFYDATTYFYPDQNLYDDRLEQVYLVIGFFILAISYYLDIKAKKDFAFWGYFFGLLTFWSSLTALAFNGTEWGRLGYLLVNLGLLFIAVQLDRKIFLVFGGIGIFSYLSHLAYKLFSDSQLFPIILSLIGLATLYLGILFERHKNKIKFFSSKIIKK